MKPSFVKPPGRQRQRGLDPGGNVDRLDIQQAWASLVTPVKKFRGGPVVRLAGIRVADIGGEAFDEAAAGALAPGGERGGQTWPEDSPTFRVRY